MGTMQFVLFFSEIWQQVNSKVITCNQVTYLAFASVIMLDLSRQEFFSASSIPLPRCDDFSDQVACVIKSPSWLPT